MAIPAATVIPDTVTPAEAIPAADTVTPVVAIPHRLLSTATVEATAGVTYGGGYYRAAATIGGGLGVYVAPYGYYGPAYGCSPAGYYDPAGYWHPYPGCAY